MRVVDFQHFLKADVAVQWTSAFVFFDYAYRREPVALLIDGEPQIRSTRTAVVHWVADLPPATRLAHVSDARRVLTEMLERCSEHQLWFLLEHANVAALSATDALPRKSGGREWVTLVGNERTCYFHLRANWPGREAVIDNSTTRRAECSVGR